MLSVFKNTFPELSANLPEPPASIEVFNVVFDEKIVLSPPFTFVGVTKLYIALMVPSGKI